MQIKQLEYARTIAETGSITQAAQKLFISQQALSETLKLLEAELGFQIFKRSNKGVLPTQAGEIFLHDLDTILPVVNSWAKLANAERKNKTVKILIQYVLSDLLANSSFMDYIVEHIERSIEIEWETLDARTMLERIETDACSIGITQVAPGGEVYQRLEYWKGFSKYVVKPLRNSKMVFVLRADDELAGKEFFSVQDLCSKLMVQNRMFGKTSIIQQIINYTCEKECYLPQSVNVLDYILQHENTVSYLPEIIIKNNVHVKNGRLVMRYGEEDAGYILYLIYKKQNMEQNQKLIWEIEKYFSKI